MPLSSLQNKLDSAKKRSYQVNSYRNSIDVTLVARESLFAHAITNVPKLQKTNIN